MDKLLIQLLSTTIALKFKAQSYHWNVQGKNFHEFHSLFSEIYKAYEENIDPLAEWLRKLDYLAPGDLITYYNNANISEAETSTDPMIMAIDLMRSNEQAVQAFHDAVMIAAEAHQHALENFFAECMDVHQKINWQLKATVS